MATFDSSALLTIPGATDATKGITQGLQLKDLMDEGQMRSIQLKQAKEQEQEQEAQKSLLKDVNWEDPNSVAKGLQSLSKAGYGDAVLPLLTQYQKVQSGQFETQKAKTDLQISQNEVKGQFLDTIGTNATDLLNMMTQSKDPAQGFAQARAEFMKRMPAILQQLPQDQPWAAQVRQTLVGFANSPGLNDPAKFKQALMTEIQQSNQGRAILQKQQADALAQRKGNAEISEDQARTKALSTGKLVPVQQTDGTVTYTPAAQASGQKVGSAATASASDPKNIDTTAHMIANGQIPMLSGFALKTPWGQAVVARVGELDPNYQSSVNPARVSTMRAFTSGSQGNTVRSLNVAISHMDTLSDLAGALQNKDIPALNKIRNTWKTQTGNAGPTNFSSARDIVANEVVKAITASGGTLADREEAQRQIQATSSPQQLIGVIHTWKQLLSGQLGGLRQQYEQGTGQKDFERFLSPNVRSQLEATGQQAPLTTGAPAAAAPGAPKAAPAPGTVEQGYKFLGGNPADPKSWQQVQ